MKEHALPQDVTGYKFHIIGNMTLKQFAEVAAGVGVGFIFYFTNLPTFIKWPLILISSGIGALAAFVPFEERPLDHWILTLFKALYRPTQFYWKRMSKIPEPFLYEAKKELHSLVKEVDLTPARRQRVKEYLHSVVPVEETDNIEAYSNQRLNEIMTVFDAQTDLAPAGISIAAEAATVQPEPEVTPQIVYQAQPDDQAAAQSTNQPPNQPGPAAKPLPTPATPIPSISSQLDPNQPKVSFTKPRKEDRVADYSAVAGFNAGGVDIKTDIQLPDQVLQNTRPSQPMAQNVSVPENQRVIVEKNTEDFEPRTSPQAANQIGDTYISGQTANLNPIPQPTQTAVQDKSLPFPAKPTQPNKIVGMALDPQNTPLGNVIIEILTASGIPARAVKTNILGQFFITTPLANGLYTISAEKAGYTFPPQSLELKGQVLDPIEVKST